MPQVERQELRGQLVRQQGMVVTPIARVTRIGWRGGRLDWHRPAAVEVRDDAGVRRIPLYNATRRAVFTIALAGLGASIIATRVMRRSLRGGMRA
jgi:hypothetical protein